jgi:S-adenosylmethionine synthetase
MTVRIAEKPVAARPRIDTTYSFSSESVAAGHPDKLCDQVSDAILDALLADDPSPENVRCAIETLATRDYLLIAGEYAASRPWSIADFAALARSVIRDLGYTDPSLGFHHGCRIDVRVQKQSAEIAGQVSQGGAGDQGLMFGYACNQTSSLMPLPIDLAHQMAAGLDRARESGAIPGLRPDGKSQVTVRYEGRAPVEIETIVLSVPHDPSFSKEKLRDAAWRDVALPIASCCGVPLAPDLDGPASERFIVNGSGAWHEGGPATDTGLTGRKIIVDTYGGWARHGGGAFSGKDATKVDRSAAYASRWVAKNLVAAGLASEVEVEVAYAIGYPQPVSIAVDTRGSGRIPDHALASLVRERVDFSPPAIRERLDLTRPIFRRTAAYGHFGRGSFPWEEIDESLFA